MVGRYGRVMAGCLNEFVQQKTLTSEAGMRKPKELYRTELVIWTRFKTSGVTLEQVAREVEEGYGLCTKAKCVRITDPKLMPTETDRMRADDDDAG